MEEIKTFTPRQAANTLPLVKGIVKDILATGQEIRSAAAEVGTGAEKDPRVVRLMDQLETYFEELEALGCSYKDWNFTLGLVDFPSVIEGREVCLCWKSDEEDVRFYHESDEGFSGRKLIPAEYFS